jgi:hypothetical protein
MTACEYTQLIIELAVVLGLDVGVNDGSSCSA